MSNLRWTAPNGLVHIVSDKRPATLCGMYRINDQKIVWEIKPGDQHEICMTCQKRNGEAV